MSIEKALEKGRALARELQEQASALSAEHRAYAEEAELLTQDAEKKARAAKVNLSRVGLRDAISALQNAAAMHQRATWSAPKGSEIARRHHAETERLNESVRAMRRIMPKVP